VVFKWKGGLQGKSNIGVFSSLNPVFTILIVQYELSIGIRIGYEIGESPFFIFFQENIDFVAGSPNGVDKTTGINQGPGVKIPEFF
jgi:hypothetical protein